MNSLLSHKWILKRCERQIVHNLFLYISNAKKKEKKICKKKDEKNEKEKKYIAKRKETM